LTVPAIGGHVLNSKLNCSEWSGLLQQHRKDLRHGWNKTELEPTSAVPKISDG